MSARAGRDGWLLPYAILMTILFSLFVVLYASAKKRAPEPNQPEASPALSESPPEAPPVARPASSSGEQTIDWPGLARGIEQVASSEIQAQAVNEGLLLRFAIRDLFPVASSRIPARHFALVDRIAETLLEQGALSLRIEGHVGEEEARSLKRAGVSGAELSALRAVAVAERWIRNSGYPAEKVAVMGLPRTEGNRQLEVRVLKPR